MAICWLDEKQPSEAAVPQPVLAAEETPQAEAAVLSASAAEAAQVNEALSVDKTAMDSNACEACSEVILSQPEGELGLEVILDTSLSRADLNRCIARLKDAGYQLDEKRQAWCLPS